MLWYALINYQIHWKVRFNIDLEQRIEILKSHRCKAKFLPLLFYLFQPKVSCIHVAYWISLISQTRTLPLHHPLFIYLFQYEHPCIVLFDILSYLPITLISISNNHDVIIQLACHIILFITECNSERFESTLFYKPNIGQIQSTSVDNWNNYPYQFNNPVNKRVTL